MSSNESGHSNEVNGSASEPVQTCTVTTNPAGLQVTVDGVSYAAAKTFSWEVESSHTVSVSSPKSGPSGVR